MQGQHIRELTELADCKTLVIFAKNPRVFGKNLRVFGKMYEYS